MDSEDQGDEEFRKLMRRLRLRYMLALRGEVPIHCAYCKRPYRARLNEKRILCPYRHSVRGISRDVCPGSHVAGNLNLP